MLSLKYPSSFPSSFYFTILWYFDLFVLHFWAPLFWRLINSMCFLLLTFFSFSFFNRSSLTPTCLRSCGRAWVYAKWLQSCPTLCNPRDCSQPVSSVHGFPGKNAGVGCPDLLQGIFPTQDWTCVSCVFCIGRQILYHRRHLGSPLWKDSLLVNHPCCWSLR